MTMTQLQSLVAQVYGFAQAGVTQMAALQAMLATLSATDAASVAAAQSLVTASLVHDGGILQSFLTQLTAPSSPTGTTGTTGTTGASGPTGA
jgi:hypothetical protein